MEGQGGGAAWHSILANAQAMVQRNQGLLADEIKTTTPGPPTQSPSQQQPQHQQSATGQQEAGVATGGVQQPPAGSINQQDIGASQATVKQEAPDHTASQKPEAAWLSDMISGCVSMLMTMQRCAEQPVAGHAVNAALANSLKMLQPHAASNQPVFHKIEQMVTMLRNRLLQAS